MDTLDYSTLSPAALAARVQPLENLFRTAFSTIDLLAMSKQLSPDTFRMYIGLARETRRRLHPH